jgi:predicted lipid carrier protein YhbT
MKSLVKSRRSQKGAGLIYWAACIVLVGFIATFLVKVVPIYLDNKLVQTGLKSLIKDGTRLADLSDEDIKKRLYNFYNINNVRSNEPTKGLKIDRSQNDRIIVKVDYQEQVNFIANIDLLLTFENHLDSSLPDLCCRPKAKIE